MDTGEGFWWLHPRLGIRPRASLSCRRADGAKATRHGSKRCFAGDSSCNILQVDPPYTGLATIRASPFPVTASLISFQLDGIIALPSPLLATTTPKSFPAVLI